MFNNIVDACKMLKGVASSAQSQPLMQNCTSLHAHARLPAYLFTRFIPHRKKQCILLNIMLPTGLDLFLCSYYTKSF